MSTPSTGTLPIFSVAGAPISSTLPPFFPSMPVHAPAYTIPPAGSISTSLPPKLVKKILDIEYVDMADLVPDSWRLQEDTNMSKCCHQAKRPRRGPVTDILLWADCYATMVSVLVEKHPHKAHGFMAYLRTILKAHRSFQGDAWVTYDMTYRRRAANQKSLDWGVIDFTLFNEAFAGRAKPVARCKFCLSDLHPSTDCCYAPPDENGKGSGRQIQQKGLWDNSSRPSVQLCMLYNAKAGSHCRYKNCKFAHLCTQCHGGHPASECRQGV